MLKDFRYNDLNVDQNQARKGSEDTNLQFPLHNQERYVSKIQFQAIQLNSATLGAKLASAEAFAAFVEGRSVNRRQSDSGSPATISELGKCNLYMPQAFSIRDAFDYQTPSLGQGGALAFAAAQQGGNVIDVAGQAISEGFQGVNDLLKAFKGADLGTLGALRASKLIPGETGTNVVSGATSASLNPNIRALFRAVGLREFTFQFKFIPTSQIESDEIRHIIDFFRYHAYPEDLPLVSGVSLGYRFPEMFRIKAFSRNQNGAFIQAGTHIKDCFLRSISTTYNPTASVYHKDGQPTEIDLSLSFIEHRTLSKKDIGKSHVRVEIDNNTDVVSGYEDI